MNEPEEIKPKRIDGWLLLLAIGMFLAPLRMAFVTFSTYQPIFSDGTWESLTSQSSEFYSPIWAPLILSEATINIFFLFAFLYLLYLFLGKRKIFPKLFVIVTLLSTIFILLDTFVFSLLLEDVEIFDSETVKELARSFFALMIWGPYLFISQRSKKTFIK